MFNVQSLIDEAIVKRNQVKSGDRDASKFHISDAGTCYRKRFYKRLGIEPTRVIDTPALRKMMAGDAGHEKLQNVLKYYGKLFAHEATLEKEHVVGHFDAIVKDGPDKVLLEIKTIEKWGMGYIKKDGPKKEHLIQMFTYWYFLREDYKDLDHACLSYVKREDFGTTDFYFNWSDDIEKQVKDEWGPLLKFWENKELPPCTCNEDYGGSGPKYCRYGTSDTECCDEKLWEEYKKKLKEAM
jgi:hypothetical protein